MIECGDFADNEVIPWVVSESLEEQCEDGHEFLEKERALRFTMGVRYFFGPQDS